MAETLDQREGYALLRGDVVSPLHLHEEALGGVEDEEIRIAPARIAREPALLGVSFSVELTENVGTEERLHSRIGRMTVPALAGERDQNEAVVVGKLWFRCPYGIAQVAEMLTGDYHRKFAMLTPAKASGPSRIDAGRAGATIETVLSRRERQRDLAASWLPSCLHYHLVWWSPN